MSPALSALLLKSHDAPKDWLARAMEKTLGRFFGAFNRLFRRGSEGYGKGVGTILTRKSGALLVYAGLLAATVLLFRVVPPGFVPIQDKQYLVSFAQLPQGATLDRTEKVIRQMSEIALKDPAVEGAVAFPGLSINGFINSPSAGIVFETLKPFDQRGPKDSGMAVAQRLQAKFAGINNAIIAIFPPPPVQGLGTIGGFKLQVEDRTDQGDAVLNKVMQQIQMKAAKDPALAGVFSNFSTGVPQLFAHLDRTKAQQLGVDVQDVFDTMQTYLGSVYVNDFNRFGRTYEVIAQADTPFRSRPEDIAQLKVRNGNGEMVPLGAVVNVSETTGPDTAMRYNGFRAADLNGGRGSRLFHRPGPGRYHQNPERDPAPGHAVRVDRPDLSADPLREHRATCIPALRAFGLPSPGGPVRKPVPAVGDHLDRAHVPVQRHYRRLVDGRRQQHLHPDRPIRADRSGLQERHPDRGVCPRAGNPGREDASRRQCEPPASGCARS